jgi:hypothetical protein
VGYGFKVWSQGLSWFALQRVDRDRERDREYYATGALYGSLIFHLGGTVQDRPLRKNLSSYDARVVMRLLSMVRVLGSAVVPSKFWRRLNRIAAIQRLAEAYWAKPRRVHVFLETRNALLSDPEQLLQRLRDPPQDETEAKRGPKSETTV